MYNQTILRQTPEDRSRFGLRTGTSSVFAFGKSTFSKGEGLLQGVKETDMNKIYYNESLRPRAKELRREATPQENKIWYRYLKAYPVQFRRQKQFARYIVDFYCSKAKLVVEIDGEQHGTQRGMAHDQARTAYLQELGLSVLRFSNREIDTCFDDVCVKIDQVVKERVSFL